MVSQPHYQLKPHRSSNRLSVEESISLLYHDIFYYPLKRNELRKWQPGRKIKLASARPRVSLSNDYFFLEGKEALVEKRIEKENFSKEKMKLLSFYKDNFNNDKNILFVGITGSLAMRAASKESDIDLMIITKSNTLWQTRLKILLKLRKEKISVRKAGKSEQEDRLCMNIWMDEQDLAIETHNPYTAHEIAQIVPLINRGGVYDKLLIENSWILNYWPNSIHLKNHSGSKPGKTNRSLIERVAYFVQRIYMSRKKTREVVTPTRAFFHPMDWSSRVKRELAKRGVEYT